MYFYTVSSSVIAGALLAACSSPSPPPPPLPPPLPPTVVNPTMAASSWVFQYSPGMPPSPTQNANGSWSFSFPGSDGVHYLTQPTSGLLAGTLNAAFHVDISPGASLVEVQPCSGSNPAVRLYFQRRGDNLSGAGAFQQYRWWSAPATLDGSVTALSVPVTPDKWTDVYGLSGMNNPGMFEAARADTQTVGVTFGGCFAGHGVYANGAVDFVMTNFWVFP